MTDRDRDRNHASDRAARAMTRPRVTYRGWMPAAMWSRCAQCSEVIEQGAWQGLTDVPGQGQRWVHESCALELGRTDAPRHDHGGTPATSPSVDQVPVDATVRVLVIGSISWPRNRAVEVRDAIAAVVRGHRRVLLVHGGRVHPDTGRLAGVDAWAELTATRLGLETAHVGQHRDRHDQASTHARHQALVDAGADVVIAFPLTRDPVTGADALDPDTADAVTRAETAGLAVLTHPDSSPPTTAAL